MKTLILLIWIICAMLALSCGQQHRNDSETLALVGGTALDLDNYGKTEKDLRNALLRLLPISVRSMAGSI